MANVFNMLRPRDLIWPYVINNYLLGKDPLQIQAHNRHLMMSYLGFASSGAEIRAASVVDIALWDNFGKVCGQPLWRILGLDPTPPPTSYTISIDTVERALALSTSGAG